MSTTTTTTTTTAQHLMAGDVIVGDFLYNTNVRLTVVSATLNTHPWGSDVALEFSNGVRKVVLTDEPVTVERETAPADERMREQVANDEALSDLLARIAHLPRATRLAVLTGRIDATPAAYLVTDGARMAVPFSDLTDAVRYAQDLADQDAGQSPTPHYVVRTYRAGHTDWHEDVHVYAGTTPMGARARQIVAGVDFSDTDNDDETQAHAAQREADTDAACDGAPHYVFGREVSAADHHAMGAIDSDHPEGRPVETCDAPEAEHPGFPCAHPVLDHSLCCDEHTDWTSEDGRDIHVIDFTRPDGWHYTT